MGGRGGWNGGGCVKVKRGEEGGGGGGWKWRCEWDKMRERVSE